MIEPPTHTHDGSILSHVDGERMFRVIHGLLLAERGDPTKACLYFGVIGALLLEHHHRVRAVPVVGMAGYRLGEHHLVFAEPDAGRLRATERGFHCWIQTEDGVIDLQAPLFPEALVQINPSLVVPRRLMQKSHATASESPDQLATGGTHWHHHDPDAHRTLLGAFVERRANQDLAQIALEWYAPSPAPMREAIQVGDGRGQVKTVPLSPLKIDGAW